MRHFRKPRWSRTALCKCPSSKAAMEVFSCVVSHNEVCAISLYALSGLIDTKSHNWKRSSGTEQSRSGNVTVRSRRSVSTCHLQRDRSSCKPPSGGVRISSASQAFPVGVFTVWFRHGPTDILKASCWRDDVCAQWDHQASLLCSSCCVLTGASIVSFSVEKNEVNWHPYCCVQVQTQGV